MVNSLHSNLNADETEEFFTQMETSAWMICNFQKSMQDRRENIDLDIQFLQQ